MENSLLTKLDELAAERGYPNRSRTLSDFVRRASVKREWRDGAKCAGAISVVYDPADSRPGRSLENLLRENAENVLSAQTHMLPEGKILVTASVTGQPASLQRLADVMRAIKGVTHGSFSIITPL